MFGYADFAGIARGFGLAGETITTRSTISAAGGRRSRERRRRGLGPPRLGQGRLADHAPRAPGREEEGLSAATGLWPGVRLFALHEPDRPLASEYQGEHRDTLLGEGVGGRSPTASYWPAGV